MNNKELQERFKFIKCAIGCGWPNLLEQLCIDIEATNPPENFEVVQIKEKHGTLRFYAHSSNVEIEELIDEAENKSEYLCEECEDDGELRARLWLRTLCDEHAVDDKGKRIPTVREMKASNE